MSNSAITSRITGLASGLDTERIVKDLLKASRAKVDAVKQQKTILEWKREYYRSIVSKLYNFQTKYFGASSSSLNFASSLGTLSAKYSSPYISVVPSANSVESSVYISDIVSLASSATLESALPVSSTPVISVNEANLSELSGKSIVISLDGTDEKTLVFREREYATAEDVQEELSAMLDSAFGQGRVSATLDGNNITLGAENSVLSLRVPGVPESDPSGILDFGAYATNRIDLQVSLSMSGLANPPSADPYAEISFSINGKVFTFEYGASLSDIIRTVNNSDAGVTMSYSRLTDKFTLTSKSTGSASSVEINDISGSLMNSLFGAGIRKDGTDAVVKLSLNGSTDEADMITLTRSSNTFEIDGTTYKLLGKAPGNTAENINIKLDYDTDAIVEKITSFINDYNELLGSLIKLTSEEVFRDYKPLTEDEKKALTDDEIKLWTEKAKSGILRSDTYLKAIESELRSSMFSQVDVIGSLASIGITTILYSEKGKLHIDKDKLKNALETDIEKTLALFTNKSEISFSLYASPEQQETRYNESGVLWRISDIIQKNLNSVGKKGALITLVGSPNSSYDSETEYSKRIKSLDDKIALLEDKLKAEEDKYWKQFTAMETALSKLYSQSAYIDSMFSYQGR